MKKIFLKCLITILILFIISLFIENVLGLTGILRHIVMAIVSFLLVFIFLLIFEAINKKNNK